MKRDLGLQPVVARSDQWLCSSLAAIRVVSVVFGAGRFGRDRFDLLRRGNTKQLLQPSRNLGSLFIDAFLPATTARFYRCKQFVQEHWGTHSSYLTSVLQPYPPRVSQSVIMITDAFQPTQVACDQIRFVGDPNRLGNGANLFAPSPLCPHNPPPMMATRASVSVRIGGRDGRRTT